MAEKLSVIELAVHFGVSVTTVYDWVKKGCPHTIGKRGKIVFDSDSVQKWYDGAIATKYNPKKVVD
jgi:phage terminase Nu1 subunit (DNA packaging protein)